MVSVTISIVKFLDKFDDNNSPDEPSNTVDRYAFLPEIT
jgi:hypothetical protein